MGLLSIYKFWACVLFCLPSIHLMPFLNLLIRVSQICTFLSNLKIDVDHNFFPLFRLKALQKIKFWKIWCIFWPGLTRPKFYYITHLCENELSRKFDFFQIFHIRPYIIFKNINSTSKMCSFEIQYDGVAQKLQEW